MEERRKKQNRSLNEEGSIRESNLVISMFHFDCVEWESDGNRCQRTPYDVFTNKFQHTWWAVDQSKAIQSTRAIANRLDVSSMKSELYTLANGSQFCRVYHLDKDRSPT